MEWGVCGDKLHKFIVSIALDIHTSSFSPGKQHILWIVSKISKYSDIMCRTRVQYFQTRRRSFRCLWYVLVLLFFFAAWSVWYMPIWLFRGIRTGELYLFCQRDNDNLYNFWVCHIGVKPRKEEVGDFVEAGKLKCNLLEWQIARKLTGILGWRELYIINVNSN